MPANYEPWADWEEEFLRETYPDVSWPIPTIAEKLERPVGGIHQKANKLKLCRPAATTIDYEQVAALARDGYSQGKIAEIMKHSRGGIQSALRVIKRQQRLAGVKA